MKEKNINPNAKEVIDYIDNEKFTKALVDYKVACLANPENPPIISNYIGECFIKIANGMANRPNFNGYSWREEMIGDAYETCLKYILNFDADKGFKPYSYFSRICWFCFLNRIQLEKKQIKIKHELIRHAMADTFSLQEHDEDGDFSMNLNDFLTSIGEDNYKEREKPTKVISKGPLDGFME